MAFSFCADDLPGGCVHAQLLILTGVRLVLGWSSGPICEDVMSEGLEIKAFVPGCGGGVRPSEFHTEVTRGLVGSLSFLARS